MRARNLFYLILLGIASACSEQETETVAPPAPTAQTRSVTFLSTGLTKYSVAAFREENNGYYFQENFTEGWSDDGKLNVQLPVGNYKFLFAYSYGQNTQLQPGFQIAKTSFEEMKFSVKPDGSGDALLRPGDELFLQEGNADSVYRCTEPTTIRCRLKRAVAQARLLVKRGRQTGPNEYVPIPYPQGDDILRYFSKINIGIKGAGAAVNAQSIPQGSGNISVDMPVSQRDSITKEGFAAFTGPFFFPAADGQPVQMAVTLYRAENSPLPETLSFKTSRVLKRNQQLIVTVWVTKDWNFTGVTVDIQPIEKEIDGEQDIWDDNVQSI